MHNKQYNSLNILFFSVCLCIIHVATLDIPPGSTTVLLHNELSLLIFLFWLRVSEERGDAGERDEKVWSNFPLNT